MADRHVRLQQYSRDRRIFTVKVYAIATVLIALTAVQWLVLGFFWTDLPFRDIVWLPLLFLFLAFLFLTIFVFVENLRFIFPCNWIVVLFMVEFLVLGLVRAVYLGGVLEFAITITATAILLVIFLTIGTFIKHDLTLDIVILMVLSMIFMVGMTFYLMMHVLASIQSSFFVYIVFVIVTTALFLMYHAQTINGHRYAEMRISDYLLAALTVYHDFIILFLMIAYVVYFVQGVEVTIPANRNSTTEQTD